jgi:hypothetical protein
MKMKDSMLLGLLAVLLTSSYISCTKKGHGDNPRAILR